MMVYFILDLCMRMPLYEGVKLVKGAIILDTMSVGLILLSLFILMLMYLARTQVINLMNHLSLYRGFMILLLVILLVSFIMGNYMYFYFFFEASLIPTLYLVTGWGYQPERLQAGVYFVMYTLFLSLPLLVGLLWFEGAGLSLLIWDSVVVGHTVGVAGILGALAGFIIVLAFLVKLPMFLVHLWLPKAHVEAPVSGSMILAAVLLKLGGFGLIRMGLKFSGVLVKTRCLFVGLSLVGIVFVGLVCCRLNDLKALVAYSSVAHIGAVICGVFTGFVFGLRGSLFMMIRHGLSSSGLFCFVNTLYERTGRRSLFMNKGVISLIPLFSLMFFLLCCSNVSAPPSINLMSEIMLIISINKFEVFNVGLLATGLFLGAVFTFYIFSYSSHGKWFGSSYNYVGGVYVEFHTLTIHLIPINLVILRNEVF